MAVIGQVRHLPWTETDSASVPQKASSYRWCDACLHQWAQGPMRLQSDIKPGLQRGSGNVVGTLKDERNEYMLYTFSKLAQQDSDLKAKQDNRRDTYSGLKRTC